MAIARGVSVLACVMVLYGLGAASSLAATGDGWTTYRTERGGFALDYPATWTVAERVDAHGSLVTTFAPPAGAAVAIIVESGTSSPPQAPDVMNTRCHEATVSGRPATTCLDTMALSLSTTIVGDGRTYHILGSRRRGDAKAYERMLATFRILP